MILENYCWDKFEAFINIYNKDQLLCHQLICMSPLYLSHWVCAPARLGNLAWCSWAEKAFPLYAIWIFFFQILRVIPCLPDNDSKTVSWTSIQVIPWLFLLRAYSHYLVDSRSGLVNPEVLILWCAWDVISYVKH